MSGGGKFIKRGGVKVPIKELYLRVVDRGLWFCRNCKNVVIPELIVGKDRMRCPSCYCSNDKIIRLDSPEAEYYIKVKAPEEMPGLPDRIREQIEERAKELEVLQKGAYRHNLFNGAAMGVFALGGLGGVVWLLRWYLGW